MLEKIREVVLGAAVFHGYRAKRMVTVEVEEQFDEGYLALVRALLAKKLLGH